MHRINLNLRGCYDLIDRVACYMDHSWEDKCVYQYCHYVRAASRYVFNLRLGAGSNYTRCNYNHNYLPIANYNYAYSSLDSIPIEINILYQLQLQVLWVGNKHDKTQN